MATSLNTTSMIENVVGHDSGPAPTPKIANVMGTVGRRDAEGGPLNCFKDTLLNIRLR